MSGSSLSKLLKLLWRCSFKCRPSLIEFNSELRSYNVYKKVFEANIHLVPKIMRLSVVVGIPSSALAGTVYPILWPPVLRPSGHKTGYHLRARKRAPQKDRLCGNLFRQPVAPLPVYLPLVPLFMPQRVRVALLCVPNQFRELYRCQPKLFRKKPPYRP